MKHILLFCYIVSVIIGVCAFSLQWMSCRSGSAGKISRREIFAIVIPAVNFYMMLFYYNDNIWKVLDRNLLLGIGNIMMIILMYTWIALEEKISQEAKKTVCVINGILLVYVCLWSALGRLWSQNGFAGILFSTPILAVLIVEGYRAVRAERRKNDNRDLIWYEMTQTVLMGLVFFLYACNGGRQLLLIICWVLLNTVNLIYIYRRVVLSSMCFGNVANGVRSTDDIIADMQVNYSLTNREKELVQEIYKGRSNGEIASELFISESTVKAHIYNIFRKTGVKNRMEIVCMIREMSKSVEKCRNIE